MENELKQHFEQLKLIVPQVYSDITELEKREQVVTLLRRSLTMIEAVYLQEPALFQISRLTEYSNIVKAMEELGIHFRPNAELLKLASDKVLASAKKPMVKAGKTQTNTEADRKVG